MRLFFPILFCLFALFALLTWWSRPEQSSPTQEAIAFLKDIQFGNLTKIVSHFGGNTCRCPARNGWGAFLSYQPGQETNLAFLLGHRFFIGVPTAKKIKSPPQAKYAGVLEKPEDYVVDVPITFDRSQYSPFFLPLPMAYGKNITGQELQDFCQDPSREAQKGLSLRLRPGLSLGAIKFDTTTMAANVLGEFKFLYPDNPKIKKGELKKEIADNKEKIDAIVRGAIKSSDSQFITPQDAGSVIMPDGSALPTEKLAAFLPRLKSVTIRLHVVRRGTFHPWTIFHFLLQNAIVEENNGTKLVSL